MASAIRLAEQHTIDIATMDIDLAAGSSGVETAVELWKTFGVPSLFVSGSITEQVQDEMVMSNPVGFIPKPASLDAVLGIITSFLDDAEKRPA